VQKFSFYGTRLRRRNLSRVRGQKGAVSPYFLGESAMCNFLEFCTAMTIKHGGARLTACVRRHAECNKSEITAALV
jgi:hypothetical protein